ncbi:MAG: recombination mediator RecR [Planctomycetota bacterium]
MSGGILESLVTELCRLPGIGAKTAERLAYHLLKVSREEALALAEAIRKLKEGVRECRICHNMTEGELCTICSDANRAPNIVCVVEQPKDLYAIEATGKFRGRYHVLGGSFSPLEDRGPESLTVRHLVQRVREDGVTEVILATNPDFEGEGTALMVARALEGSGVEISRLARGMPSGSQIDYMNSSIIGDAFEGRRSYGSRG